MNPTIQLDFAVLERLESGIISARYDSEFQIDLEGAKQVEKAHLKLAEGNDMYTILVATSGPQVFTEEAMVFLSKEAESIHKVRGSAIVLDSLANRITARVYIRFHRPIAPTKIFSTEEKAEEWLLSLRDESK